MWRIDTKETVPAYVWDRRARATHLGGVKKTIHPTGRPGKRVVADGSARCGAPSGAAHRRREAPIISLSRRFCLGCALIHRAAP